MVINFIVFRFVIMDRIIDYRMLSSLSDDMKKVLVDIALEAYLDGLSDGVNI